MNTKLLTAPAALSLSLLALHAHADTTQVPSEPTAMEAMPALTGERTISIRRASGQNPAHAMPADAQMAQPQMAPAGEMTDAQMAQAQMSETKADEVPSTPDEMADTAMEEMPVDMPAENAQ